MKTELKQAEILFIGAHPDDVELGCGGTIIKAVEKGHNVAIVDMTAGEMGTRGSGEIRLKESAEAAKILGVSFRHCMHLPDTKLKVCDEFERAAVDILRIIRPRIIFTPYPAATHPDHVAASEIFASAWYKAGFGKYESPLPRFRPARVINYYLGQSDNPSFVVDISAQIDKRRAAIACYASQFFNTEAKEQKLPETRLSSPGFSDALEVKLRYFGQRILKTFGEPFFMNQLPEIEDPAALTDPNWIFKE
ncbi:MAG: bacillithiol biosynthesis deacetylase BshB1 [Fibrobacteres bacterium]|nr:bacillithiol biosynthesis deacetylase BshB1 [Fibrobacterota bacterium]